MKKIRLYLLSLFTILMIFTSCTMLNFGQKGQKTKDIVKKQSDKIEKDFTSHPKNKPYTLGSTPEEYSLSSKDKRMYTIKEKLPSNYPDDGVKGLYFSAYAAANPEIYPKVVKLIEDTDLNTVVVDIKDDWGNVTFDFNTDDEDIKYATNAVLNPKDFIEDMHKRGIYVIGRITTFKDSVITEKHNDWAFRKNDGTLWKNGHEETFMNPFLKEVWDYDVKLAKLGAKFGFDEIQFDYVRFAEGFETFGDELDYSRGSFEKEKISEGDKRVKAITNFVAYARDQLSTYNVPMGIDVFGYAMQVGRADGIGQDFSEMSNETDIMCSMIYPSHWGPNSFDIPKPDLEPYNLVYRYLEEEQEIFKNLKNPPKSRPWIQDFTASYIGEGNYMEYDKDAVQAQINAIYDMGQNEFLIWNAVCDYTTGVNYKPR